MIFPCLLIRRTFLPARLAKRSQIFVCWGLLLCIYPYVSKHDSPMHVAFSIIASDEFDHALGDISDAFVYNVIVLVWQWCMQEASCRPEGLTMPVANQSSMEKSVPKWYVNLSENEDARQTFSTKVYLGPICQASQRFVVWNCLPASAHVIFLAEIVLFHRSLRYFFPQLETSLWRFSTWQCVSA